MLRWILIVLAIAIIAAVVDFGGIAGAFTGHAQMVFWLTMGLLVLLLYR